MRKLVAALSNFYDSIMNSITGVVTLGQIKVASVIFMIITVVLIAMMIYSLLKKGIENKHKINNFKDRAVGAISSSMEASKIRPFSYKYIEKKLKYTGMKEMFEWLNPITWVIIEVAFAVILFLLVLPVFGFFAAVLASVLGALAPNYIADASNKQDNRKIIEDLRMVYDIFRIQSRAGAYTSVILSDCYMMVSNPRLRSAFKQLIADITVDDELELSLEKFREKFSNEYVDSLVLVIKQSLVTGTSVQMLNDIKAQIENLETALITAEKEKSETRIVIVQLLLYIGVIAVSAFIAITAITDNLSFIG